MDVGRPEGLYNVWGELAQSFANALCLGDIFLRKTLTDNCNSGLYATDGMIFHLSVSITRYCTARRGARHNIVRGAAA